MARVVYTDDEGSGRFSPLSRNAERAVGERDSLEERLAEVTVRRFCEEADSPTLKRWMDDLERKIIVKVLADVNGHQRRAAKILGLKPTTLYEKTKRHRIRIRKTVLQ